MDQQRHRQVVTGIVLIALGLALYGLQFADLGRASILFVVGGAFLAVYFYRKEYGFLVPGCIVTGLAVGMTLRERDVLDDGLKLGLGCGFVAIYLIGLLYERNSSWWPLIPGGILIFLGVQSARELVAYFLDYWPLVLVFIGVLIVIGAFVKPRSRAA